MHSHERLLVLGAIANNEQPQKWHPKIKLLKTGTYF